MEREKGNEKEMERKRERERERERGERVKELEVREVLKLNISKVCVYAKLVVSAPEALLIAY